MTHPDDRPYSAEPCGSFFRGVLSAVALSLIGWTIVAILWIVASNAFAASADRPDACAEYRGAEVAACIAEMGQ